METNRLIKNAGRIIITILFCSCSSPKECKNNENNSNVYICTGPNSRCFHLDSLCVAFNRCTGERIKMPLDSAVMEYDPCGFCVKRDKCVENTKSDTIEVIERKKIIRKKYRNINSKHDLRNPLVEEIK